MDYGKMAYLKTEELEARMTSAVSEVRKAAAIHRYKVRAARTTLASGGKGTARRAAIVKVEADSGGGTVYLLIGGKRAAFGKLKEGRDACVMFAVGSGDIELDSSAVSDARTLECELLLPSDDEEVRDGGAELKAAQNGAWYLICRIEGGDILLTLSNEDYSAKTEIVLDSARAADVCAVGDGFMVVYADNSGQAWSVALDRDMRVLTRNYLGPAPKEIGVTGFDGRAYVFYTDDGKAYCFSTGYPWGNRGWDADIGYNGFAERITAVKDSKPLAVIVESGGRAYMLKERTDVKADAEVCVCLKGRAESV